jgi:hypothetical protein
VDERLVERIQQNNATFREANERIRDRADELGANMERIPFLCECPVEDCTEIIHMTMAQYADVRQNPRYFMTAVGHERSEEPVGEVVSRNDGYVVVEKAVDG